MPDSINETTLNDKTMFEEDKGMHKDKKVYDEVARVAYELFEKRGKIHGYSMLLVRAERIVLERHANEIDKEADSIRAAKKVKASEKTETTPAKAVKKPGEGSRDKNTQTHQRKRQHKKRCMVFA